MSQVKCEQCKIIRRVENSGSNQAKTKPSILVILHVALVHALLQVGRENKNNLVLGMKNKLA